MEAGCRNKENCHSKEMGTPELELDSIKVERDDGIEGCLQIITPNIKSEVDEGDTEVPVQEQTTIAKVKDTIHSHINDSKSAACSDSVNDRLKDELFNCKMCEDVFQNQVLLEEHLFQSHNIHNPQFSSRLIKFWSEQKDSHSIIVPYTCPVIDPKPRDIASLALMSDHHSDSHEPNLSDCEIIGESLPTDLSNKVATDGVQLTELSAASDAGGTPSSNTQQQLSHSLQTHSCYKRKYKSSRYKNRKKNQKKLDMLKENHSGNKAEKHTLNSMSESQVISIKEEPGESAAHPNKGIDNDPFMRCFLKEVETKQETGSNAEQQQEEIVQIKDCSLVGCLNTGNLLYVYPLVEIRTGYSEEEETEASRGGQPTGEVPKIEVFYRQPVTNETSNDAGGTDYAGMDTSQSSNSFEAENLSQKVFIVSPLDRDMNVSPSEDANTSEEDALWSRGTFAVSADSDIEFLGETIRSPLSNHSNGPSKSPDEYDHCILCKRSFPDKTQLQKHMLSKHIDEYCNKCCICFKRFETIFKVRSHVMMEHIDVQCKCCQRRFLKSTSLRKHMVKHSVNKFQSTFKRCEICLKTFHTATDLADHVQTAHPLFLKHQCDLCDKTFLTEDELFIHVDEDPHVCLLCSGYFQSTLSLREHLLGHATDRQVLELFTNRDRGVQ